MGKIFIIFNENVKHYLKSHKVLQSDKKLQSEQFFAHCYAIAKLFLMVDMVLLGGRLDDIVDPRYSSGLPYSSNGKKH